MRGMNDNPFFKVGHNEIIDTLCTLVFKNVDKGMKDNHQYINHVLITGAEWSLYQFYYTVVFSLFWIGLKYSIVSFKNAS